MLLQAGTVPPPAAHSPEACRPGSVATRSVTGLEEAQQGGRPESLSTCTLGAGQGHRSPYTVSADSKGTQALAGSPAQKSSIPHVRACAAGGLARGASGSWDSGWED